MRSKIAFITTVLVCAALAFAPVMAAERGVDRQGDRSKSSDRGGDSVDFRDTFGQESRVVRHESRMPDASLHSKASALLSAAAKQEGSDAIASLTQILTMGLSSSVENDRVISDAYSRLAGLYENPAKQVHLLGMALAYEADPSNRTRLESRVGSLGGDVFAMAFRGDTANQTRTPGFADTCDDAVAVVQPFSSGFVLNIEPGDTDWFSFNVTGPLGEFMRIETASDTPGAFDDDSDLTLYGGCVGGLGDPFLAFNDDCPGNCNAPFMSRIDTDCLTPGTYYVEVGGFADISFVDNFELQIETTATCILPVVDAYEPDDTNDLASAIGHPTSTPPHANGWGRAKKEIQSRSIFPAMDTDNAEYSLTRNELVRMETDGGFPTFFNDFASTPLDGDSVMELRYQTEKDYGGRCNEPDIGFINSCAVDQECIDLCGGSFPCNGAPLVDLPICMPYYFFNVPFGGSPADGHQNPLASDDDGGNGLASQLVVCMPRTAPNSDSASVNGPWVVRVDPFSSSAIFAYELLVKNEVSCNFESEPNNSFSTSANPMTLGVAVHGIFDFSESNPLQDSDWFSFDLDEEQVVAFETFGYDSFACDTYLQLAIGPDDFGDYFLLATNDDGGSGWLSRLDVILPPANDLLGNTVADADYLINVTSAFLNPNFPYTLASAAFDLPSFHQEADLAGACATEGAVNLIGLGEEWSGTFDVACDFDAYKLTLTENTFVTAQTLGSGDTTMEFVDCGDDSVLACDDDGGVGLLSQIDGCLPAGDYCVRVRPFSTSLTFDYGLTVNGTAGCTPTSPPTMTGDGLYRCSTGFDTCP